MKNSKLKNFLLAIILVLSSFSLCLISYPDNNEQGCPNTLAYTFTTTTESNGSANVTTPSYTQEGNIPFALFTSGKNAFSDNYNITQYHSTYTSRTSTDTENAKTIYYYTIDEESIPYIWLSSNPEHTDLYNLDIYFKFNDPNMKIQNQDNLVETYIPINAGFISIDASINGDQQLYVDKTYSDTTDDCSVVFSLNLQPVMIDGSTNLNCKCPILPDNSTLGGNGIYNDVSYRVGLYRLKFNYSFKYANTNEVSNQCIFETAFYVVDYNSYVEYTETALSFENTDTFTVNGNDTNYEIFNYNYKNAPVVGVDATKFTPNFLYTTGFLNYNFTYNTFNSIYTRDYITSLPFGTKTGSVILKLEDTNLMYSIPTYKTLPKNVRLTMTYSGNIPFQDNLEFNYLQKPNQSNNDKNTYLHFYSTDDEYDLVWVDCNNNGIYDSGDTFYLEKGDEGSGYLSGTDYLWKDTNNNGYLDLEDHFYLDANSNGICDDGETQENSLYSITRIEINSLPYYAQFDLQDFETNFLIPNKINSTFLGTYTFNLDFLIKNSLGNYSVFSSSLLPNAPSSVVGKKLLLFGYNLKYNYQNQKNVELKNDYTWANFISYNVETKGKDLIDVSNSNLQENGNMKNVPTAIAITNQAPLRFDYFGNLYNSETNVDYVAKYLDKATDESTALSYFQSDSLDTINGSLNLNSQYYQGAAITSDGIKIMKLEYKVSVVVDDVIGSKQITGCQYFVFEISNAIQNLYIQSVDYDANGNVKTSFDFNKYTNKDVRVNIEHKPNSFFAPVVVTYNYYNYSTSATSNGTLSLKTETVNNVTKNVEYKINSRNYNYYVLNNNNKFTFTANGSYKVVIKSVLTNIPVVYTFTIDRNNFNGIEVNGASLSNSRYVIDEAKSITPLQNQTKLNAYNMIISDGAFTLGWNEKESGATSYSYVYYMEMQASSNLENSMFNVGSEYWLTNGYKLTEPSAGIDTYVNYKSEQDYSNNYLKAESYFNKDGIYIFFVYDEAGNYFTITVLIDSTLGKVLQGYWENNVWKDTFDPVSNPQNYVKTDTTLYFGTHKAIFLPDMSNEKQVSIDDKSFTRAYDLTTVSGDLISSKTPISFDLYTDILNKFTSFVKNTSNEPLIKNSSLPTEISNYYLLTLQNVLTKYERTRENGEDSTGTPIVVFDSKEIDEIYVSKIFVSQTTAMASAENNADYQIAEKYKFYGEAQYTYKVTNINGLKFSKNIEMNFDVVNGTFYGYNKTQNSTPIDRFIRKNSGTNLDVLKFTYNKIEGDQARYYALSELSYTYYQFLLDDSSLIFDDSAYPFSKEITKQDNTLLNSQTESSDHKLYIIDGINLDASGLTQPGKYVITRRYVGGDYNFDGTNYVFVESGGRYYKNGDNYIDLFENDTIERKYVVYVDHNGIISTNYMIRKDEAPYVREVGNFISLTLSDSYDDEWNFKEFFLTTTSNLELNTNKVPVRVNIPLSKYFVYYHSNTNNLYAKQAFADLDIVIYYRSSPTSAEKAYVIDGNNSNGMCTCSQLPNGELVFTKAGSYRITIQDHTGYLDNSSNAENANNIDPTKLFGDIGYCFTISHNSPTAGAQQRTYNYEEEKLNNEQNLVNDYDSKTFATNIKQENFTVAKNLTETVFNESFTPGATTSSVYYVYENETFSPATQPYSSTTKYYVKKDNNEMTLTWSDPLTPYEAKVKQIDITVSYVENGSTKTHTFAIDLNAVDELGKLVYNPLDLLPETEDDEPLEKIVYTFNNFSFITYFEISFYNNISYPSVFDNQEYYRFSYKLSLNLAKEYRYKIDLSYVSKSNNNQSYRDENGVSYANSLYTLYIDRTKPSTNIDSLLNSEQYLISSNYYSSSTINQFKEENFDVSTENLQAIPSAFTYTFAVANNFTLTYNSSETMPYFFVRNYNKYGETLPNQPRPFSSITQDMVDSVYNEDKAYFDKNYDTKIPGYYPRFSEVGNTSIIYDNYDIWYKINYRNNTSLRDLIISATHNSNPTGFYEIIERDLAGNYRCYTVYFNEYTNVYQNLKIDGYTKKNNAMYLISTSDYGTKDNITANGEIEITELSSAIGWGTLEIKNETADLSYGSINLNPFNNLDEVLQSINSFLNIDIESKFSFKLITYNSNFKTNQLSRYVNFILESTKTLDRPIIEEYTNASTGEKSYNLILPNYNNTRVLYLEEFTLKVINQTQTNTYETIVEGCEWHNKEDVKNKITGLTKGIYKAIYKDNFNDNEYYYILHIGEYYINDFNKEYSFEFSNYKKVYNPNDGYIYYSGGKIYVTYESNIYNVYVNNILYSGTANETASKTLPQCKTFTLYPSKTYKDIPGSDYAGLDGYEYFIIEYKEKIDNSEGKTGIKFVIYNLLPEISLTTTYGGKLKPTLEENETQAINSVVNLNWGYITFSNNNFEYISIESFEDNTMYSNENRALILEKDITSATLYKKNDLGEYKVGIICPRGQQVTEEGFYKLVLSNSLLGNYREIYFVISFKDIPLYSVYANGDKLSSSKYEQLNLATTEINNTHLINIVYNGLKTITDDNLSYKDRVSLYKQLGFSWIDDNINNANFSENNIGICNIENVPHFYSIQTPNIVYNSNMKLDVIEFTFRDNELRKTDFVTTYNEQTGLSSNNPLLTLSSVGSNYWTTIFLVYNLDGPIRIELFAFTKVPKTSQLLNSTISFVNQVKTNNEANNQDVFDNISFEQSQNPISYTLTNQQILNNIVTLKWDARKSSVTANWYNQGNVVVIGDTYGYATYESILNSTYGTTIDDENNKVVDKTKLIGSLKGTGIHILTFKDIAGNVHEFASNTYYPQKYYTLYLIDSVIYHINVNEQNYNPIQYGVFNSDVKLVIDDEFISQYSELNVEVSKNGVSYKSTDFKLDTSNYTYVFSDPGKYLITLSASYGQQRNPLKKATYNFTIINKTSARLAYEFVEISGYEFLEVTRNGENISNNFRDSNLKIPSIFISSNSELSGNGYYTLTLKYGENEQDKLTFSLLINDFVPTISCNVKHGETTTANIVITYNPSIIYEQLGECYIKVLTYNNDSKTFNANPSIITIDANSFVNSSPKSFEITRSNSYFIQVETKNGNIISSFRVNKKDPLNTIAIIIIIIAAIAVVILTIIIIKLRTRMKIK